MPKRLPKILSKNKLVFLASQFYFREENSKKRTRKKRETRKKEEKKEKKKSLRGGGVKGLQLRKKKFLYVLLNTNFIFITKIIFLG